MHSFSTTVQLAENGGLSSVTGVSPVNFPDFDTKSVRMRDAHTSLWKINIRATLYYGLVKLIAAVFQAWEIRTILVGRRRSPGDPARPESSQVPCARHAAGTCGNSPGAGRLYR